jgi:hypothetical protein
MNYILLSLGRKYSVLDFYIGMPSKAKIGGFGFGCLKIAPKNHLQIGKASSLNADE